MAKRSRGRVAGAAAQSDHSASDNNTRQQIIQAADRLFYHQGYERTSFAHLAAEVNITRGNFYHHFKSKDEILDAVIGARLADTQNMLDRWEAEVPDPADRIREFIRTLIVDMADIQRYGCPVGTLATELAKLNHASQGDAHLLLVLVRTWLRKQFALLGRKADADVLAVHLLAHRQGVTTLATAFHDEKFIQHEVKRMYDWLNSCINSVDSAN